MRIRKLNKAHKRRLNGASVAVFARILDAGTPTRFRWEGTIRAGIHVYLILHHGLRWQTADDNACQVLKAAFWKLRIVRPSWHEGQPEWTRLDGGRIYCANEACRKPIERDSFQALMYCCEECRIRAKSKRGYLPSQRDRDDSSLDGNLPVWQIRHMRKINQAQLLEFTGAGQRDVENWMSRLPLATKYEFTVQGRPRGFSKENVVEIALLNRMVKNGMSPAAAAEYLAKLFKDIRAKKPHGYAIFFTKGNMPIDYMVSDKLPSAQFLSMIDGAFVLNVAKLETDVDEFLAGLDDD